MGVGNFFGMLPDTMQDSRLYGVELDSITGRIAQKLYPEASIKVAGFETTDRRDFYDLAVGNVPFGQYRVNDKAYNKFGFSIHNYFFAKAIDQVRPGGIVAFVTSRYTLDSKDSSARKHIAERADLLGAIRLPNTAFKANHILWAGVALMLLSVLLTLFTSMANDGSVWDFAYLTEQVIKNNMSMIFPMCISLIAGYMISREQTDDTLKNILTVPISFKKLLTGKLIVCGVLSIIFGLICSLFTIIAEMIVGFPGFEISLALKAALQITAVNFFLYLAVLPIIALTCRRAGSFLVGVIIAFVYGYGGMFAAGNMTLANLYPITASLGMVGYRSYDTAVNWNIGTCSCSLALAVVISAILILCMKEREATQTKKKAKKVAPKKGW